MINIALIIFFNKLTKPKYSGRELTEEEKALSQYLYQPTTLATMFKQLWKIFDDLGIMYTSSDFNFEGSFQARISTVMNDTSLLRSDYGTLPLRGVVDVNDYKKLKNANPPLLPFINYKDMLMILAYKLGQEFQLRAGPEVTIFIFYLFWLIVLYYII